MGDKADVVGKVQVFQLFRESLLDASPLACCGLSHDPIHNHQEDGWSQDTTLTYTSQYLKRGSQFSLMFVCLFVCFDHKLFTPASTPKVVDFCMHGRLYSRLKGSRAPSSGRLDL